MQLIYVGLVRLYTNKYTFENKEYICMLYTKCTLIQIVFYLMKRFYLLIASLLVIFSGIIVSSCETDIDVTADWKDITVVYGLLSQNDTLHYLKINKAFLGDGNALEYAQIEDSSSYFNNLEVTLTEVADDGGSRVFNFDTIHVSNKEDGIFYSDDEIIYKSEFIIPSDLNDRNYLYDLKVRNKITGKEITSSTNLVKNFDITVPRPGQPTIDFISNNTSTFKWKSGKDGRRYDAFIRFWFEEVLNNNDTIDRYIDWKIGSLKAKNLNGGEEMTLQYTPLAIYDISKSLIPRTGNEKDGFKESDVRARLTNKVEFTIVVSGDALNTYLDVNGPSSGIVQDRPEYTNIKNGLGLFSSRYTKHNSIQIGAQTEAKFLAIEGLKFVNKIGN